MVEVSEAYTSQRCSRCGEIGDRHRVMFKCDNCGLEIDADKNGAHNIAKRSNGIYGNLPANPSLSIMKPLLMSGVLWHHESFA